jgi:hypothetical protein
MSCALGIVITGGEIVNNRSLAYHTQAQAQTGGHHQGEEAIPRKIILAKMNGTGEVIGVIILEIPTLHSILRRMQWLILNNV